MEILPYFISWDFQIPLLHLKWEQSTLSFIAPLSHSRWEEPSVVEETLARDDALA